MLKCHSELFKSSVKLADGFKIEYKRRIEDIAQLLLLSVPSKLRKKSMYPVLQKLFLLVRIYGFRS